MNPVEAETMGVPLTQRERVRRQAAHDQIRLMGMRIDKVTGEQAVARILDGEGGVTVTPNLDHLRKFCTDATVARFYEDAELVAVDGMPLVWASRIMGSPLPERIAGSNMIWTVSEAAAERGIPVFLLGGNPGAAEGAAEVLTHRFPRLEVAGTACPPVGFERDPEEIAAIAHQVQASGAQIVFAGLPLEKMMPLVEPLRTRWPGAWYVEVGVSFSFVTGEIVRAPIWMQRAGIEWLHRLSMEPRRLARRYLVEGLPFAARLFASVLHERFRGPAELRAAASGHDALAAH
jgi:N-acetylglucosaminyldiphosphoundecaprenol N-acetyl-beta-D-mannosaminyltransferase